MSKSPESYILTRFNALKWGTAVDGPRHCPGRDRCRYRWCEATKATPGQQGKACWWEAAYSQMLADHFCDQYGHLARAECIDDFRAVARRAAALALNRLRISTRSNNAWELVDSEGQLTRKAFKEIDICDRYFVAAINGEAAIMRLLQQAHDELAERVERSRRIMMGLEPNPDGRDVYREVLEDARTRSIAQLKSTDPECAEYLRGLNSPNASRERRHR